MHFQIPDKQSSLVCKSRDFEVYLTKPLPGDIDPKRLHLLDSSCTAQENETHVIFTSSLNKCDTSFVNSRHMIQYRNAIIENMENKIIYRGEFFNLPIRCNYQKIFYASPVKVEYASPTLRLRSKVFGSYEVDISIYTDNTYTKKFSYDLVEVDPTQKLHFEVEIVRDNFKLGLFLDKCYGEPVQKIYDRQQYTFIENG